MNEKQVKERISEMVDGELNASRQEEMLNSLLKDTEAARRWERYQLIGAAMRNESGSLSDELASVDVVDRVRARLADEPTVLAPLSPPARSKKPGGEQSGRSWVAAGALAMAASVAALAVITFTPRNLGSETQPVAALVAPAPQVEGGMEGDLMGLLVEHGEFSAVSGLNGLVAYAKFVGDSAR